jgi:hypothetical protein
MLSRRDRPIKSNTFSCKDSTYFEKGKNTKGLIKEEDSKDLDRKAKSVGKIIKHLGFL